MAARETASVGDGPETVANGGSTEHERKGKRGHDDQGNVRPADDRYGLHEPEKEPVYVRSEIGTEAVATDDKPVTRKGKR